MAFSYNNKVEICGVNTSSLPVLKEAQKMELLRKIRQGDKSARNELISGNLKLVLSVIQRFTNRGENPDDLFQVGCIGLIKAIDNFDVTLNVRFSTYAVPMICGSGNNIIILREPLYYQGFSFYTVVLLLIK